MKKLLLAVLIFEMMILVGCKETEKATFTERYMYADEERSCFCIRKKEDIEKLLSAAERKDYEYVDNMLEDGRAFVIKKKTKVSCSDKEIRRGIVLVKFLEGEHEGEYVYTFSKRVR